MIKLEKQTEGQRTVTLTFDGGDAEKLLRLSRMPVSVPELLAKAAYSKDEWVSFLDRIRSTPGFERPFRQIAAKAKIRRAA